MCGWDADLSPNRDHLSATLPYALWVSRVDSVHSGVRPDQGLPSHERARRSGAPASQCQTRSPPDGAKGGKDWSKALHLDRSGGLALIGRQTERLIDLAADPQTVKQDGELAGDGDHGALLGALAALGRQSKPEAAQV